jgi:hypothetical protein
LKAAHSASHLRLNHNRNSARHFKRWPHTFSDAQIDLELAVDRIQAPSTGDIAAAPPA